MVELDKIWKDCLQKVNLNRCFFSVLVCAKAMQQQKKKGEREDGDGDGDGDGDDAGNGWC